MKKIFILSILIMPVMANADNVGPSAASGTPVIATANAPYAIVDTVNGDTNHVVTASYVKEAYNDTIAAVNKVNADKQDNLVNMESSPHAISNVVVSSSAFGNLGEAIADADDSIFPEIMSDIASDLGADPDNTLATTGAILEWIQEASNSLSVKLSEKRISAVTTWGNDTPTKLTLTNQ